MLHDAFLWWDVGEGDKGKTLEAQGPPFGGGIQRGKAAIDKILRCKICHYPPNLPDPPRTSLHGNRRFGL